MIDEEFHRRVLEVYEKSGRVTNIAVSILRKRYGENNESCANVDCCVVRDIWKKSRLETVKLSDYVGKRIAHYAGLRRFNRDPVRIADAVSRELKEDILGYSITDQTVREKMKNLRIKPARKPRYRGGSQKRENVVYMRSPGKKISREERKRYRYAVSPDAIR